VVPTASPRYPLLVVFILPVLGVPVGKHHQSSDRENRRPLQHDMS
jgi:hypothetical protein